MSPVPRLALPALLLLLAPCGAAQGAASLYQRMGGRPVVSAVVADLVDQAAADPRIGHHFAGSNLRRIKAKLFEQICQIAGGGCRYTGDSLREVHAGHAITQADFFDLVQLLRGSLRRHHVALRERNELLALLAPMSREVINVRAPRVPPAATSAIDPGPPS